MAVLQGRPLGGGPLGHGGRRPGTVPETPVVKRNGVAERRLGDGENGSRLVTQ